MASDADYAAFLEKANQDTGAANTQSSGSQVRTKSVNMAVPHALSALDEYYTSDSDERFEPVSLKYSGKEDITAAILKDLIGHDAEVEDVAEEDFNPTGQYKSVVDAVKKAGDGSVKVFRVVLGEVKCDYYVVSNDKKVGIVVGMKAFAVES